MLASIPDTFKRVTGRAYLECLDQTAERTGAPLSDLRRAAPADIEAMERALECVFPPAYSAFLEAVGCGQELGGVATWYTMDLAMHGNAFEMNQQLRDRSQTEVPRNFVAVYEGCGGVYGFLRTRDGSCGAPVYRWDVNLETLTQAAESFQALLARLSAASV